MKLNYYILWVEDDSSWFATTSELFEETIRDYGFCPIIERKKTFDEVKNELKANGLKKYDIFLIDFKLRNSKDGDSIIDFLREENVYTDIIFYSSDKQTIIESIKEHLFEGVYHSDRKEVESKFEKVFLTTVKKIEEINSMRGLIVGETSDLDAIIEESLTKCIISGLDANFDHKRYVDRSLIRSLKKKQECMHTEYETGGIKAIVPLIDAIKKWELLRCILKKNKSHDAYIGDFLEVNNPYQKEVIELRNVFAHAKSKINADGKEFLESSIGSEPRIYDEDAFKKIRVNLRKHRESLIKLQGII